MNIEEQKENFLSLLRNAYKAKKNVRETRGYDASPTFLVGESLDEYDQENRVKVREDYLKKYGFEGADFWEIICPALKEEGYLEDFGDPNRIPAKYYESFLPFEDLKKKVNELHEQLPKSYAFEKALGQTRRDDAFYAGIDDGQKIKRIDDEMEKAEKELGQIMFFARTFYPFFVVNEDKLFDDNIETASRMRFDSQNGVVRCGTTQPHSFHRGNKGDKPLLCLFRKLWDERRWIHKGIQKKAGKPFPPEALASQAEVSKEKLPSMLKSINRILKKFPAKIERENGILLIITEK